MPYLLITLCLSLILSCSDRSDIQIGFIGPITGRSADLGIAGRNGALLAIEQINAAGGVNGRQIQLIINDDEQSAEKGEKIVRQMIDLEVDALLGPMTSGVAVSLMPLVDEAELTMLAVTATSEMISNKNDFTLRTISSTAEHAARHAGHHYSNLEYKKPHIIYDLGNKAYTSSWVTDYSRGFTDAGGEQPETTAFTSGDSIDFDAIAATVLEVQPDLVVFCTNSLDAAAFARAFKLLNPRVQLASSEWSGTERLISLGGKYVEDMIVPQYINREDTSPGYISFLEEYKARFSDQEPGFAGKVAYNGANVLAEALKQQKKGETLRDTIVRIKEFEGLQSMIIIDKNGDSSSDTFLTRIKGGKFSVEERL